MYSMAYIDIMRTESGVLHEQAQISRAGSDKTPELPASFDKLNQTRRDRCSVGV